MKYYKIGTLVRFSRDVCEDDDVYHDDIDEYDCEDEYLDHCWVFDDWDIKNYTSFGVGKIIDNDASIDGSYTIKFIRSGSEINLPHFAVELARKMRLLK